jgi:hypothetical protein
MPTIKLITSFFFCCLCSIFLFTGCKTAQIISDSKASSFLTPFDTTKAAMLPVLEGKLGKKFFHAWTLTGGEQGTATNQRPFIYRLPIEIPIGKWLINVNTTVSHRNGQLRMWIETDQGVSESAFMNGYSTGDGWQTFTLSHFFSGVETKSSIQANIVLVLTVGKNASSAELGSVSHVITGFQMKKASKVYSK